MSLEVKCAFPLKNENAQKRHIDSFNSKRFNCHTVVNPVTVSKSYCVTVWKSIQNK